MNPLPRIATIAFLVTCGTLPGAAQSYPIKSIHFKGNSDYTDTELSAAADLKNGVALTTPQMNDHAKLLMDTGMFQNVSFKFNGQDLTFELTPVGQLYAVRLENIPVSIAMGLDERLHARFPLYHGKIPVSGGLVNGVQEGLEDEVAAAGVKATVTATPYTDISLGKLTAMSFAISEPEVEVGPIQLQGASPAFADRARAVLAKTAGSADSSDGSVSQLQTDLTNFYGTEGYLEAKIHAVAQPGTVVDAHGIHIPFLVTVDEGLQYKLAGLELAPGSILTQAEFDKVSGLRRGEVVSPVKLRACWEYLRRQYRNRGYMHAEIIPEATFDRAQGTVSYSVSAAAGQVYTTGNVRVRNVSEELRDMTLAALKLKPGEPFNEGAIRGMTATHLVNPAFERIIPNYNLSYTLTLHEGVQTVDVDINLGPRHP